MLVPGLMSGDLVTAAGAKRFPERLYFHAATLDDLSVFQARFVVFEEEAQPWDPSALVNKEENKQ